MTQVNGVEDVGSRSITNSVLFVFRVQLQVRTHNEGSNGKEGGNNQHNLFVYIYIYRYREPQRFIL